MNPAHINQVEVEIQCLKGIAHGMLTVGFVSAILGMQLPGPGSIYLGQELKFMAPVKIGDTIKAEVEIIEKFEDKNIIKLST